MGLGVPSTKLFKGSYMATEYGPLPPSKSSEVWAPGLNRAEREYKAHTQTPQQ